MRTSLKRTIRKDGCGVPGGAGLLLLLVAGVALGTEPPTTLTVKIPAYEIVKYGEFSHIDMPGGQLLVTEEGRPEIYYYMHTQDYPKGYRIQAVTLKSRSPEQKQTGVKLPPVLLDDVQKGNTPVTPGRYPEKDFDWNVTAGPSGGSMLAIAVYPFVYDPGTSELTITTSYDFDVRYVKTMVTATDLTLDEAVYNPGQTVQAKLRLENSGSAQPVNVSAFVTQAYGGVEVGDIPEQKVARLAKSDSVTLEWQTGTGPSGDYVLTAVVKDPAGNDLARLESPFRVGNPQCELTSFSATPQQLKLGSTVQFALELSNTGSMDLAGQAVVEVRLPDSLVQTLSQDFKGLAPGQSRRLTLTWNTKSAQKGARYEAIGYAAYNGMTTLPRQVVLSTNAAPTAAFSFKPDTVRVNQAVSFDATASSDKDGTLVGYAWDLGDGAAEVGATLEHVYTWQGDYTVTLTVTDNEGGTGTVEKTITVME
jgi:hypothetical protein